MDITLSDLDRMMEQKLHQHKETEKEQVMPSYVPRFKCGSSGCNVVHPNPNFNGVLPKAKCENCGQFARDKDTACPWCMSMDMEELDADELRDLGVTP